MNQPLDTNQTTNNQEGLSTTLWLVSFILPIVGLVLYFTNKESNPVKAKGAISAALYGIGSSIVFFIIQMATGIGQ